MAIWAVAALVAVLTGVTGSGVFAPASADAADDPLTATQDTGQSQVAQQGGATPPVTRTPTLPSVPVQGIQPPASGIPTVGPGGTGGNATCRTRRIPGVEVHSNCAYLDVQVTGHVDDIAQVYVEAMGRPADPYTLAYWVDQFEFYSGHEKARSMIPAIQAAGGLAPGVDPVLANSIPDYVESLYVTLLGRPSDPGGKDYWVGQIARNTTETVLNVGRKTGKDAAQVAREMNESPDSLQSQARYARDAAEAAAWAEYMASPQYVAPDSGGY